MINAHRRFDLERASNEALQQRAAMTPIAR